MNLRRKLIVVLTVALASPATLAQGYPSKPIRIVVPFPPGGGTDLIARESSQRVARATGWIFVIDNKPGAGGNLGVDAVAAAKAQPGAVNFASPGNGTVAHLTSELFQKAASVKTQHIPYKGAAQALTDVISGNVELYMSSVPTLLGQIKQGKLRALAVTSARRVDDLPNVPTLSESGYKGFDAATWFGFLAPANTPREIVSQLNTEFNKALQQPELRKRLADEGAAAIGGTSEQFATLIKEEIARWGKVVRESGARVD